MWNIKMSPIMVRDVAENQGKSFTLFTQLLKGKIKMNMPSVPIED